MNIPKIRYINHNIIILISSYPFISLINCPWLLFHGIILLSYSYFWIKSYLHYLFIIESHLQSYPCPININYFWNIGFLLGISIVLQLITGILLALHYTPDINYSYYSIMYIIRDVYYGWSLRYIHSNGASFLFTVLFIHVGRGLEKWSLEA